jgi:phosphoenolpyruvate carboxylase
MNVELAVLQADQSIMHSYAGLVENSAVREHFQSKIDLEFELTTRLLQRIFKETLSERRPMQLTGMKL